MLSKLLIDKTKHGSKTTRLWDGRGLYLEIAPSGGKWWRFKYRFGGKEKRLSLVVYPDVGLKGALHRFHLAADALHPVQKLGFLADGMSQSAASARMAQLKSDLNETRFAWSGPTNFQPGNNITAYYRIQGPHLVIEYAPQNDEPTNHVHTIYRDPTNDYGRQLGKQ